jgi:hypothetical protein
VTLNVSWKVSAWEVWDDATVIFAVLHDFMLYAVDNECTSTLEVAMSYMPALTKFIAVSEGRSVTGTHITGRALQNLIRNSRELLNLCVHPPVVGCSEDCLVEAFAQSMKLEFLMLTSRGVQLTDRVMTAMAEHCPQLGSIRARVASTMTDVGITALASNCRKLSSLYLTDVLGIADGALYALAEHSTELVSLTILGDARTTEAAHLHLVRSCTKLTYVFVQNVTLSEQAAAELDAMLSSRRRHF